MPVSAPSLLLNFPFRYWSGAKPEDRVSTVHCLELPPVIGYGSRFQLAQQVRPLEAKLPPSGYDPNCSSRAAQFAHIKMKSATARFGVNRREIRIDRSDWPGMCFEPGELRMISVSARASAQYRPGQKTFAPERDEPSAIEVGGVQRPEPQDRKFRLYR